jgi:hypothetical protein
VASALRICSALPPRILSGTPIVGLAFDTRTGRLREVVREMHK